MAVNPQLFGNGMPVPFVNELFLLAREGVEFEVDKIPEVDSGKVLAKGTIYLSNVRMVFVANKPIGNFVAFDLPLLYIHEEKFNQPVFFCNNISGKVDPVSPCQRLHHHPLAQNVIPEGSHSSLFSPHSFKILFKEGGCGTFVPLFFNLLRSVRQYHQLSVSSTDTSLQADPLHVGQLPVDEMMRHAYVDPNDPTRIFLQQPEPESQLRRRNYQSQTVENCI